VGETRKRTTYPDANARLSVSSADRVVGETYSDGLILAVGNNFQYPRRIEWWVRHWRIQDIKARNALSVSSADRVVGETARNQSVA